MTVEVLQRLLAADLTFVRRHVQLMKSQFSFAAGTVEAKHVFQSMVVARATTSSGASVSIMDGLAEAKHLNVSHEREQFSAACEAIIHGAKVLTWALRSLGLKWAHPIEADQMAKASRGQSRRDDRQNPDG